MNRPEIIARLDRIMAAYRWSRDKNLIFSASQRICLTRERVALLHCIDKLNANPFISVIPKYKIPLLLEVKLNHIHVIINQEKCKE